MITKKEDLINTYIENDHGELRDLYLRKCEDLGLFWRTGDNPTSLLSGRDCIGVSATEFCVTNGNMRNYTGARKLTLPDLKLLEEKPKRTKVEYAPVDYIDAWEPVKAYCDGERLFDKDGSLISCPEVVLQLWIAGQLYRRIETEIDWCSEVSDFLGNNLTCHESDKPWFSCGNEFEMDGKLNEKDFLGMCRVALRANGELD